MGRTACTEPQCLYKGALYLYLYLYLLFKTISSDDVKIFIYKVIYTKLKYVQINASMKLRQMFFGLFPYQLYKIF